MQLSYSKVGLCQAAVVLVTNHLGSRLTTIHATYPRFIHPELMTHREFSRNARSSRAVPVKIMLEEAKNNMVVPIHRGSNKPGMVAGEENNNMVTISRRGVDHVMTFDAAWRMVGDTAIEVAEAMMEAGYHKQIPNRLLEPFTNIHTLISSVRWNNFFDLRLASDVEPHMRDLAQAIKNAMADSGAIYNKGVFGGHHLPYVEGFENPMEPFSGVAGKNGDQLLLISAARCARISYKPFDSDKADIDKDVELGRKLITERHMSPFDHIGITAGFNFADVGVQRNFNNSSFAIGRYYAEAM